MELARNLRFLSHTIPVGSQIRVMAVVLPLVREGTGGSERSAIGATVLSPEHGWELSGDYPVFTVVMVIYHYVERIWRVLITPNLLYNICDNG